MLDDMLVLEAGRAFVIWAGGWKINVYEPHIYSYVKKKGENRGGNREKDGENNKNVNKENNRTQIET